MVPDLNPVMPFVVGFFVLAALAALLAVGAVVDVLLDNRRARLARHESVRAYYGRLALSH